jgi:putative addiction module component (TIGR02574 family)
MKEKASELTSAALALPKRSRAKLVARLLDSLVEPVEGELLALWGSEAEARLDAYERGQLRAIPGEEVFRDLKRSKR